MNNDGPISNRVVNIGLLCLVVVVGFLLWMFLSGKRNNSATAYISKPFVQNIRFPYKMSDNELYFYTGHGFAALDITMKTTRQLGVLRTLPAEPTSVQWVKGGAIIQTANYNIFDDLGSSIASKPFSGGNPISYLWYVPFEGPIKVIAGSVSTSFVDTKNEIVYYASEDNEGGFSEFKTYSIANGKYEALSVPEEISNYRIAYAANRTVYALKGSVRQPVSLVKIVPGTNPPTVVIRNVFESDKVTVDFPFVMVNEDFAVFLRHRDSNDDLSVYSFKNNSIKTVATNFEGTLNQSSDSSVTANNVTGNKFSFINITSSDKSETNTVIQPTSNVSRTLLFGEHYFFVDFITRGYLIGQNKSEIENLPQIKSGGLEKALKPTDLYSAVNKLNNAVNSNEYNVFVSEPLDKNKNQFVADVKAAGFDPNQLVLTFLAKTKPAQ